MKGQQVITVQIRVGGVHLQAIMNGPQESLFIQGRCLTTTQIKEDGVQF